MLLEVLNCTLPSAGKPDLLFLFYRKDFIIFNKNSFDLQQLML